MAAAPKAAWFHIPDCVPHPTLQEAFKTITNDVYQTQTGIPASLMEAGHDYLILVSATVSRLTSANVGFRVWHDGGAVAGTLWSGLSFNEGYHCFFKITQGGLPASVELQAAKLSTENGGTAEINGVIGFIDLTDLNEGTDYQYFDEFDLENAGSETVVFETDVAAWTHGDEYPTNMHLCMFQVSVRQPLLEAPSGFSLYLRRNGVYWYGHGEIGTGGQDTPFDRNHSMVSFCTYEHDGSDPLTLSMRMLEADTSFITRFRLFALRYSALEDLLQESGYDFFQGHAEALQLTHDFDGENDPLPGIVGPGDSPLSLRANTGTSPVGGQIFITTKRQTNYLALGNFWPGDWPNGAPSARFRSRLLFSDDVSPDPIDDSTGTPLNIRDTQQSWEFGAAPQFVFGFARKAKKITHSAHIVLSNNPSYPDGTIIDHTGWGFNFAYVPVGTIIAHEPWGGCNLSLPVLGISGSGNFFQKLYTGTGDLILPALIINGNGTFGMIFRSDDADLPLPTLILSGTGTFIVLHDTQQDLPLPPLVISGEGQFSTSLGDGASDAQLPLLTLAATATFLPPGYATEAAIELPTLTVDGSGSYVVKVCDPFEYDLRGRLPIAICQGLPWGTDFPLVSPSDDIRNLLADFYLAYEDPADYDPSLEPFELPFQIAWLFGLGCVASEWPPFVTAESLHAADLIIWDVHGQVVFDSTIGSYDNWAWGSRLHVHQWQTDSSVCRLVAHTKWYTEAGEPVPQNYDIHLTPENGVLDERTLKPMPRRLKSVTIDGQRLAGEIEFYTGYNTRFSSQGSIAPTTPLDVVLGGLTGVPLDGGRAGTVFMASVVPGAGDGQYPGCQEPEVAIRRINGVVPDLFGRFLVGGDEQACVWVTKPSVRDGLDIMMVSATLQITDNCPSCCSCDDFVQVKLGIDSVFKRWQIIADRLMVLRQRYIDEVRTPWIEAASCRQAQNQQLVMTTNCSGFIGIGYGWGNYEEKCIQPLEVQFDILIASAAGARPNRRYSLAEPPDPSFGPEQIQNPRFTSGLAHWTGTGYYSLSNGMLTLGRNAWSPSGNLLDNGDFEAGLTSWSTTGLVTALGGPSRCQIGTTGGSVGTLWQTIATDANELYKVRLHINTSVGTNYIEIKNAVGTSIIAEIIPNLTDDYYEVEVLAEDASLTVELRCESAADNYLVLHDVLFQAWSGTLVQDFTGVVGENKLTVGLFRSDGSPTIEILAGETSLFSHALPTDGLPYTMYTADIDFAEAPTRVRLTNQGLLQLVEVSLKEITTTPESGGGFGAPIPAGAPLIDNGLLAISYYVKSARRNSAEKMSVMDPYDIIGDVPHLSVIWDMVNPRQLARASFILFGCNAVDGDVITITATPIVEGVAGEPITTSITMDPGCPSEEDLCGAALAGEAGIPEGSG